MLRLLHQLEGESSDPVLLSQPAAWEADADTAVEWEHEAVEEAAEAVRPQQLFTSPGKEAVKGTSRKALHFLSPPSLLE